MGYDRYLGAYVSTVGSYTYQAWRVVHVMPRTRHSSKQELEKSQMSYVNKEQELNEQYNTPIKTN